MNTNRVMLAVVFIVCALMGISCAQQVNAADGKTDRLNKADRPICTSVKDAWAHMNSQDAEIVGRHTGNKALETVIRVVLLSNGEFPHIEDLDEVYFLTNEFTEHTIVMPTLVDGYVCEWFILRKDLVPSFIGVAL